MWAVLVLHAQMEEGSSSYATMILQGIGLERSPIRRDYDLHAVQLIINWVNYCVITNNLLRVNYYKEMIEMVCFVYEIFALPLLGKMKNIM